MGLAVGGLGVFSLHGLSLNDSANAFSSDGIKSTVFFFAFAIVLLVIAYLTRPDEASFRRFLTELSFRHHITRLTSTDDPQPSDPSHGLTKPLHSASHRPDPPLIPRTHNPLSPELCNSHQPFQFSSRASVSLRTPNHVFRSFIFFTVAVVSPLTPPSVVPGTAASVKDGNTQATTQSIAGSWFIGAFNLWWMGGKVVARNRGTMSLRSRKGEEVIGVVPSRTGLLTFRSLDTEDASDTFKYLPEPFHNNNSSTKVNLRNRSSSRSGLNNANNPSHTHNGNGQQSPYYNRRDTSGSAAQGQATQTPPQRSNTPPPLPKSASLPLHANRITSDYHQALTASAEARSALSPANPATATASASTALASSPLVVPSPVRHRTSSDTLGISHHNTTTSVSPASTTDANSHGHGTAATNSTIIPETSPVIDELMVQLSASQNSVKDVRAQLTSVENASAASRAVLEREVEEQRAKKRAEDAARAELRARTKSLDEERRSAEAAKREGEKKLKNAHNKREEVERRITGLNKEIERLMTKIEEEEKSVLRSGIEASGAEKELEEKIREKKKELEVAEKVLGALNERARELDAKLVEERKLVQAARDRAAERKKTRGRAGKPHQPAASLPWPPPIVPPPLPVEHLPPPGIAILERPALSLPAARSRSMHVGSPEHSPPLQHHLSLNGISNTGYILNGNGSSNVGSPMFAHFNDSDPAFQRHVPRFFPFGDSDSITADLSSQPHSIVVSPTTAESPGLLSPLSTSLIPSSLIQSMNDVHEVPQQRYEPNSHSPYFAPGPYMPSSHNHLLERTGSDLISDEYGSYDADEYMRSSRQDQLDAQRAAVRNVYGLTIGDSHPDVNAAIGDHLGPGGNDDGSESGSAKSRRWFSPGSLREKEKEKDNAKDKPKKGLNPDAKVFKFTRGRSILQSLNPGLINGPTTSLNDETSPPAPATSFKHPALAPRTVTAPAPPVPQTPMSAFFSSLRAFQPSPAEREALRRALGGSANTSLERISSRGSHGENPSPTSPHFRNAGVVMRPANHGASASVNDLHTALGSHAMLSPWPSTTSEVSIASLPPTKKSFKFNPWASDKKEGDE